MKRMLTLLLMLVTVTAFSQIDKSAPIAYATPEKDTLYVSSEAYLTMVKVWNKPYNTKDKPVIISVDSIYELKKSLGIKED